MAVSKYPLQGMQIKKYLWTAANPTIVHDYYRNNIDFSRSRDDNLESLQEYAKEHEWPYSDVRVARRLIVRSHRVLDGLEDLKRDTRREKHRRQNENRAARLHQDRIEAIV